MRDSLRRASAMILSGLLAALGASLAAGGSCRAIELPFREFFLGANASSRIQELDSLQTLFSRWETSFWELYRAEGTGSSQDYHQFDSRLWALARRGWLLYGFEARRNDLSLGNSNTFTDADRMSGGRTVAGGGIILGVDGTAKRFFGKPRCRALGAIGWSTDVDGFLEAELTWGRRAFVSARALAAASEIEIDEDINGHRYPFLFPIRTEAFHGEAAVAASGFQLAAFGGSDVSHGDGTDSDAFGNALYFRWISFGMSVRRGIRLAPGDSLILRRLEPGSTFPGLSLTAAASDGNGDIGMENGGVRYLRVQDANVASASLRLDFIASGSVYCSAGWNRVRVEHEGDSFFDVWPFSVWDIFSAKRYRLGGVDGHVDLWHVGGGFLIRRSLFDAELRAQCAYIDDSFAFRWYEREDILYPFVFTYVAHDEAPVIRYRYVLEAQPALSIRATGSLDITLSGSFIVPFGREEEEGPPAPPGPPSGEPEAEGSTRGGLFGTVVLTYRL